MTSISSSSRYHQPGPIGGAPHNGRPVQLEMPRLLGARPDQNGDFFWGSGLKASETFNLGFEESRIGHSRMPSRPQTEYFDAPTGSPPRARLPSTRVPSSLNPPQSLRNDIIPRERPADPGTVLGR